MRQDINLLQFEKPPEVPRLSFGAASVVSACFFVFLVGISWADKNILKKIHEDIATIEKNNSFQQKEAISTGNISQHQNQLQALEGQLMSKYQLWANYKKITDAGKNGFSQHFYHIANLADENLSLYEIEVYDRGSSLAMKGYAKKPEYIPIYIDRLKKKAEFDDVFFGDLSIEKLKGHEVLRFALAKKEEKEGEVEAVNTSEEQKVNVSDLLKMSLANALNKKSQTSATATKVMQELQQ